MRLVGGGNDLFVTIGILLLFAGALFALQSFPQATVPGTAAFFGVFAWLVAEFVTRQKRMRLSSTVLGLGFIGAVATLLSIWLERQTGLTSIESPLEIFALSHQGEPQAWAFILADPFGSSATQAPPNAASP